MKWLRFLAMSLALLCGTANAWRAGTTALNLPDFTNYPFPLVNLYTAFMSPFNATAGTFWENLAYFPATFPNGTTIVWSYPTAPCVSICGFLNIQYGFYDTGGSQSITSKQLSAITTLTATNNLTMSGTTNGWDVLYDIFLTNGAQGTHANEIEILIHTPTYSSASCSSGSLIGTTTISGINWTAYLSGTIYCVYPTSLADVPSASIDIHAIFNYLIANGGLSSSVYYNGHALGVEPRNGTGQLTYNSLSVVYN